jgi:hypothetical protein
MRYQDFSIKVEPKQGDAYPVTVLSSPAGEGDSYFVWAFDPAEPAVPVPDANRLAAKDGAGPERSALGPGRTPPPEAIGERLFDALFCDSILSLLDRSLGMLEDDDCGLRIRIHIDPDDPSLAPVANLPWETLYRRETQEYLGLSRYTPVVRHLEAPHPSAPLRLNPPLRILVAMSQPDGYPHLDLAQERGLIEKSWARVAGVQVDFMEHATSSALQERLRDAAYHVIHYMGHGGFDESTGHGVLLFEGEDGREDRLDGPTLGMLLRDAHALRLVLLNACNTARAAGQEEVDPFAGVASALVLAGVPAVVAMQAPISDGAAIRFARQLYTLLARGEAVDTAVTEGRRAIRLAERDAMEWGTPVLFMRTPNGDLFQPAEAPPPPEIPRPPDEQRPSGSEPRAAGPWTLSMPGFPVGWTSCTASPGSACSHQVVVQSSAPAQGVPVALFDPYSASFLG